MNGNRYRRSGLKERRLRRASPRRLVEIIKNARRRHPQWAGRLTHARAGMLAANPRLLAEISV
jgi:hypothetical protein